MKSSNNHETGRASGEILFVHPYAKHTIEIVYTCLDIYLSVCGFHSVVLSFGVLFTRSNNLDQQLIFLNDRYRPLNPQLS